MSIETDYATLRRVLHEHQPEGWAVEFGVYSGYSLGIIAAHMPVIGFDSFEGLPEDWREGFPKGTFGDNEGISLGVNLLPPAHSMIVPGWFEDTCPTFPFPPLGLVHIDCDLYSSTVTALDAITPHLRGGAIIVFDEYHGYPGAEAHEAKAFEEWCIKNTVSWAEVAIGSGEHAQERAVRIDGMMWGEGGMLP